MNRLRLECRAALAAIAIAAALLRPVSTCAAPADAPAAPEPSPSRPKYDWHPPITARVAGQAILGARLSTVPFQAYGYQLGAGVPIDAGPFILGPGFSVGWLLGESEYGLELSAVTIGGEFELRPRGRLRWLRSSLGGGYTALRLERATDGPDMHAVGAHIELMLSADVLRLNDWLAFWLGAAVRHDEPVTSAALLGGLRI